MNMKRFAWKIGLIAGFTLAGLAAMWPPAQKLKLGIDLSGGTILVYEVITDKTNRAVVMEDLISALKRRADPEGVKEIPIRNVGGNRIEIILPQASNEEVEEVKKMLTDQGSLKFRILANHKHDSDAIQRALGPGGLAKPPNRYEWARLGEVSTGANPRFDSETIIDIQQEWKKDLYNGYDVFLTGKDSEGRETTVPVKVKRNNKNTLRLDK